MGNVIRTYTVNFYYYFTDILILLKALSLVGNMLFVFRLVYILIFILSPGFFHHFNFRIIYIYMCVIKKRKFLSFLKILNKERI